MNNALGFLVVIIALAIQGWMTIFQIPVSINDVGYIWYSASLILLFPGSVLLATTNIIRLFEIYHRINYVVALIGLIGASTLLVFRGFFASFLFPYVLIIYFLILDLFWIFMLGLLFGRFKTVANKAITAN